MAGFPAPGANTVGRARNGQGLQAVGPQVPLPQPNDGRERHRVTRWMGCLVIAAVSIHSFVNFSPPVHVPILLYHEFGDAPSGMFVPADLFEKQMDYVVVNGCNTIGFDDLLAYREQGKPLPPKPLLITVDDGYASIYNIAYPILAERGLTATFFVHTAYVDTPNHLTWAQLRELISNGFEVGSHTVTHPRLTTVENLADEVAASRWTIEHELGIAIDVFSYPYGDYDERVIDAVREAGYRVAVTIEPGYAVASDAPYSLPRFTVRAADGLDGFVAILQGAWADAVPRSPCFTPLTLPRPRR